MPATSCSRLEEQDCALANDPWSCGRAKRLDPIRQRLRTSVARCERGC